MLTNWKVYVLLVFALGILHAKYELSKRNQFIAALMDIEVIMPSTKPPFTQESIELAFLAYGIQLPLNCSFPEIDETISVRGMVQIRGDSTYKVSIGKPAFKSWGLLGSTLAHEIEVHCNQSMTKIFFKNIVTPGDKMGVCKAERQAYLYEIANAKRFGLTKFEVMDIGATVNFYYPNCK